MIYLLTRLTAFWRGRSEWMSSEDIKIYRSYYGR